MNVAQALADRSARNNWQHNPAYLVGSSSWTHGQVHGLAARAATVLAERGVRPRQHVLLSMPDGIAWIATFLALARLGAVAVTTNPRLTVVDHTFIAEDCRAQLVITDSPERFDGVRCLDAGELLARAETSPLAAAQAVPAHAPLYVQYTSGTTGRPIGVPHRHADLEHYHRAVGSAMLHMTEADVSLSVSKLHFAYGFGNSFVYPLLSGSAAVLLPEHPAPSTVAEAIDRHLVSVLHAVPSAYANLLAEIDGQRFPSLRVAVSAGERLAAELGKRLTDILGAPVLDELGCTEVGGAFCANTLDSPGPGTLGFALPGYQVRLRDDSGRDIVDCGVDGELWVTGPTLLAGYLNQPERTAQALRDGWLNTGDRAAFDDRGRLIHKGRKDDLEMVGGITVDPVEIERILDEHPTVQESAVAAIADQRGATKLRAYIVPTRHAEVQDLERELLDLVRDRLAPFKVPRSVAVVTALPRTGTGKLRRFILRSGTW